MGDQARRLRIGNQFSEGARLLWQAMQQRGLSQAEMRRTLGAAPGMLTRWLYGDSKPSASWVCRIEDIVGVPASAWGRSAIEDFVPPAQYLATGTDN